MAHNQDGQQIGSKAGSTRTLGGSLAVGEKMTSTGVDTPIGGVAPAGGTSIRLARPGCVHTGGVAATVTASGVSQTVGATTELYYSELFVPCNMLVTGISLMNGTTATTDDRKVALLDADGAKVTGSDAGPTLMATANIFQKHAFTGGAITLLGPATYFVATMHEGTTGTPNAHGIGTDECGFTGTMVAGKLTGEVYATGIPATNTLTYTFTTDLGPIASLY